MVNRGLSVLVEGSITALETRFELGLGKAPDDPGELAGNNRLDIPVQRLPLA